MISLISERSTVFSSQIFGVMRYFIRIDVGVSFRMSPSIRLPSFKMTMSARE